MNLEVNDYVLFRKRDNMGAMFPGEHSVAKILRINNYSGTNSYDVDEIKPTLNSMWALTLSEHDIVCKIPEKDAQRIHKELQKSNDLILTQTLIASVNKIKKELEEAIIQPEVIKATTQERIENKGW